MATFLDDRSREVLKSLIQLHIATGEPVGSESLARTLNRSLSPATLRNIMADLEKLGYLAHPHTSAGRMPTDEGYRVYVDSLTRHLPLAARDAAAIDSELRPREGSSSEVMETASHILSRLSRNVGFVVAPEIGRTAFRHIDLVRLPHPRVLVVMVSSTGLGHAQGGRARGGGHAGAAPGLRELPQRALRGHDAFGHQGAAAGPHARGEDALRLAPQERHRDR
jgi:heat-inducible transcriptional repressor